jgi:LysR family cys regulon transcriptional activator
MELRQLRSLVALVENDFSVTRTAARLHLVQSAVSQHISRLEEEVGTVIFTRHGKRLVGLTGAGGKIVHYAYRVLAETRNISALGKESVDDTVGVLRIGATHTQARYVLPPVIKAFRKAFPKIELQIHQGTPQQLVDMAITDTVDFSICTEAIGDFPELASVPCYQWNRSLIAKPDNPLLKRRRITLQMLCSQPIITYVFGFTGRSHFSNTFFDAGLTPQIVLSAVDTDVIKTYVREGMGIGIIASLAYDLKQDADLEYRDLSALFPWEITKIAYQSDKFLRRSHRHFIDVFQDYVSKPNRWLGMLPANQE